MIRQHNQISEYRQTKTAGAGSDPHQLVALLLAGVLERIRLAMACIDRGETAGKARAIGNALEILDGLRLSLDHRAGGEIAGGLESIYDYASQCLVEANLRNDAGKLAEVLNLLGEIESAWLSIPERLGGSYDRGSERHE